MASLKRIGKYQVLATLQEGTRSSLLHIRRHDDACEYFLKLFKFADKDDPLLEQAKREAHVADLFSHPNLLKCCGFQVEKDWLFRIRKASVLMEFVKAQMLDRSLTLPMQTLLPVFTELAIGLIHMHSRGDYHVDIQPSNILVGLNGHAKLMNFGSACIHNEPKDRPFDSVKYIAPETLRRKIINDQSDIFSFGATLYRQATLKDPPSCASSTGSLRVNEKTWLAESAPARVVNRRVPEKLSQLIQRCMAFNPEQRPGCMRTVYDEVKEQAAEMGEYIEGGTDAWL